MPACRRRGNHPPRHKRVASPDRYAAAPRAEADARPAIIDRRHNGGLALDDEDEGAEPAAIHPVTSRTCRWCRHWQPPPERDERDYEALRNGVSRRWMKRPAGVCDRVLYSQGKPVAFSATNPEFSCLNFEARPPAPRPKGGGWTTIWKGDRIVWQGREEGMPAEQTELHL